jgi:hypothetical protein
MRVRYCASVFLSQTRMFVYICACICISLCVCVSVCVRLPYLAGHCLEAADEHGHAQLQQGAVNKERRQIRHGQQKGQRVFDWTTTRRRATKVESSNSNRCDRSAPGPHTPTQPSNPDAQDTYRATQAHENTYTYTHTPVAKRRRGDRNI